MFKRGLVMRKIVVMSFAGLGVWMGAANAQFGRGAADWVTNGGDAQRSSWIRTDAKISRDSLGKPGFQFLWKVKFASDPRQSGALTAPVLLDRYIGYRGFRSLGFMGSGSNGVYAVDTDLGRIEWQKQLSSESPRESGSTGCAEAFIADVTRPATAEIPSVSARPQGFGGRGGAARGAVGQPGEGAVTLAPALAPPSPNAMRPPGPGPGGPRPGVRRAIVLHALSSDGMLHTMYVSNGEEPEPPSRFLPPNTASHGLIVIDNVAYAAIGQGCGAASGVLALDLSTKEVVSWTESGIAGAAGAAMGPDATLYVATTAGTSNYSASVVALASKTLVPKDWYTAHQAFMSSPVVFQYKNKLLLAAATKDGSLHLLDTASLGGPDHQTPVHRTQAFKGAGDFVPGALASWQDRAGTRWLLARASGSIVAWKVADQNGAPALQPGWVSRDLVSPAAPLIVNGVVFALSTGGASILHALDATTGKELWNSADAIGSSVRGLSAGGGQVYVTTQDGTVYAFGFWMER
jgi:outer membrane protein assembly factor BamB